MKLKLVLCFALTGLWNFADKLNAQTPTFAFEQDTSFRESLVVEAMRASAKTLPGYERKLEAAGTILLRSRSAELRAAAADTLRLGLERALALPLARKYSFDSLRTVSTIADASKTWQIFTWQEFVNDSTYRYHGLFVPRDSSLAPVVLLDRAQEMSIENDFELRPDQWYGAVYYGVHSFALNDGRPAWILFGYDADAYYHRRKIADVLTFDRKGHPRFGAEVFVGSEQNESQVRSRIILEYRTDARVGLNFDVNLGGIVHDRLVIGPAPKPGYPPSYVPDGSYDGFTLDTGAGVWRYRQEYFDRVISTEPPRPAPILGSADKRDLFGRPRNN